MCACVHVCAHVCVHARELKGVTRLIRHEKLTSESVLKKAEEQERGNSMRECRTYKVFVYEKPSHLHVAPATHAAHWWPREIGQLLENEPIRNACLLTGFARENQLLGYKDKSSPKETEMCINTSQNHTRERHRG